MHVNANLWVGLLLKEYFIYSFGEESLFKRQTGYFARKERSFGAFAIVCLKETALINE